MSLYLLLTTSNSVSLAICTPWSLLACFARRCASVVMAGKKSAAKAVDKLMSCVSSSNGVRRATIFSISFHLQEVKVHGKS